MGMHVVALCLHVLLMLQSEVVVQSDTTRKPSQQSEVEVRAGSDFTQSDERASEGLAHSSRADDESACCCSEIFLGGVSSKVKVS